MAKGTRFTGLNIVPIAIPDGTTYTVDANHTGKVHIIPDLSANMAITLPAAYAGLSFEFWYGGAAADAEDFTLATAATTSLFKGGVVHLDHNAGAAGIEVVAVYADASDDDLLTVDIPEAGTCIKVVSDGTHWWINGTVVSDTAPVFA